MILGPIFVYLLLFAGVGGFLLKDIQTFFSRERFDAVYLTKTAGLSVNALYGVSGAAVLDYNLSERFMIDFQATAIQVADKGKILASFPLFGSNSIPFEPARLAGDKMQFSKDRQSIKKSEGDFLIVIECDNRPAMMPERITVLDLAYNNALSFPIVDGKGIRIVSKAEEAILSLEEDKSNRERITILYREDGYEAAACLLALELSKAFESDQVNYAQSGIMQSPLKILVGTNHLADGKINLEDAVNGFSSQAH